MHQARRDGMDIDIRDIPGPLELTAKAHENGPITPQKEAGSYSNHPFSGANC